MNCIAIGPRAPARELSGIVLVLREVDQYGVKVLKPACDLSLHLANIARTKTITHDTIREAKAMGFGVVVDGQPGRVL